MPNEIIMGDNYDPTRFETVPVATPATESLPAIPSSAVVGGCVNCKRDTSGEMTWPGEKGGEICQECWEAECSRSWWKMVAALDAAGLMEPPTAEVSDGCRKRAHDDTKNL